MRAARAAIGLFLAFMFFAAIALIVSSAAHPNALAAATERWPHIEECTGISRPFSTLVDSVVIYRGDRVDPMISGSYDFAHRMLELPSDWHLRPQLVDHELVHVALAPQLEGAESHPAKYFRGNCGDLITPPDVGGR